MVTSFDEPFCNVNSLNVAKNCSSSVYISEISIVPVPLLVNVISKLFDVPIVTSPKSIETSESVNSTSVPSAWIVNVASPKTLLCACFSSPKIGRYHAKIFWNTFFGGKHIARNLLYLSMFTTVGKMATHIPEFM